METIIASTDTIRLSFLMALLRDGGLAPVLLDQHIAAVEGNIGMFPRRIAVAGSEAAQARRILREAGEL
ncbi:MAG: putative signal transducing protein [Acidiphilium sp.]